MESDRKREILVAEARFQRLQQLAARLATAGVYVIGPLNPGLDADTKMPDPAVIEQARSERGAVE